LLAAGLARELAAQAGSLEQAFFRLTEGLTDYRGMEARQA